MQLKPITNTEELYSQIDLSEADADFARAVLDGDESIYVLLDGELAVGCAQLIKANNAYLYVYTFPMYRGKGHGKRAHALLEATLRDGGSEKITTCYLSRDKNAARFAKALGYKRQFASVYMEYEGEDFSPDDIAIRPYRDEDYDTAHALYAEAFHRMRVSTGDFPDSIVEKPSDKMKKAWADTADERLVCLKDDAVIGYAHLDGCELASISIAPEYQGMGYGRKFVRQTVNILRERGHKKVSLCCVVGNKNANALYMSLGFKAVYVNDYAYKTL